MKHSGERQWTITSPAWRTRQQASVAQVFAERQANGAETTLLVPAAQHPLLDGTKPNKEFTTRLESSVDRYEALEGKAQFFLPGSRHHDTRSGQTDRVALYDAAGLWLVKHGIKPEILHGKGWIDRWGPDGGLYSGAEEIEVAAAGYNANSELLQAEYICSPGQTSRARIYGLAFELPLVTTVPEAFETDGIEQFAQMSVKQFAVNALCNTIEPKGKGLLYWTTRNRIPADGNMDSLPSELAAEPDYSKLPWYN